MRCNANKGGSYSGLPSNSEVLLQSGDSKEKGFFIHIFFFYFLSDLCGCRAAWLAAVAAA